MSTNLQDGAAAAPRHELAIVTRWSIHTSPHASDFEPSELASCPLAEIGAPCLAGPAQGRCEEKDFASCPCRSSRTFRSGSPQSRPCALATWDVELGAWVVKLESFGVLFALMDEAKVSVCVSYRKVQGQRLLTFELMDNTFPSY